MLKMWFIITASLAMALTTPAMATATSAGVEQAKAPAKPGDEDAPNGEAKPSITRHKVKIGGREIAYTATAARMPLKNEAGDTEAEIFYVAYRAEAAGAAKRRPLMFFFNGGPGAASVWLHLGAVGPRKVQMLPDGNMPPPPFTLVDNPYSWLDQGDLVFVDPVGTGYSRAAKPDQTRNYATVRGDIDSLGRFIRLYLTQNNLWNSPVFLVGESYGSFRSAGLADHLVERGIALNGLILISFVLNLQTISFDFGNDLPYQLFLPSYTATAWHHEKLAPDLQADLERTVSAAEDWAAGEYLVALGKGDRLSPQERAKVAETLARFTGLSRSYVESRKLRIENRTFARELLGDRGEMAGIMDSRFSAANLDPGTGRFFDPTVTTIRPPFTAAFNSYAREELGFKSDLEYYTLGGGIERWDWEAKNSYADTSRSLRDALAKNPYMKVFIASGLFDLATPHFGTEYTVAHLGLPPELRRNFTMKRYRAGHMMYLETASLAQLKTDVAEFMRETLK